MEPVSYFVAFRGFNIKYALDIIRYQIRLYRLYKKYGDSRLRPYKFFAFPIMVLLVVGVDILAFLVLGHALFIVSCQYFLVMVTYCLLVEDIKEKEVKSFLDFFVYSVKTLSKIGNPIFGFGLFSGMELLYFLGVCVDPKYCYYERIFIATIAVILCLVFGIKSLRTSHKDKKELAFDILLLLCPLLLFFSRDFCIPCLLPSGLQICRMALREKRRGAPLLKTHWERLVIWKFMAGVFFILWGCVETVIRLIR